MFAVAMSWTSCSIKSSQMDEVTWLASTDPAPMLEFLQTSGRTSDRKLRLFGVACSRRVWDWLDALGRAAVEVAEMYADGQASADQLRVARLACKFAGGSAAWYAAASNPAVAARNAALSAQAVPAEHVAQAALLRDIVGPWGNGTIPEMAEAVYAERDFSRPRLAALAEALERAGCNDSDLLSHLRGPGRHSRGCFVVDALLGKS
jgi:hypothetical protein